MKLIVEGVNGLGEIDTNLDAWFTAEFYDEDSSVTVIDSASGETWNANMASEMGLNMTGGRYVLYLTNTEPETLDFQACDAELLGLFDQGLVQAGVGTLEFLEETVRIDHLEALPDHDHTSLTERTPGFEGGGRRPPGRRSRKRFVPMAVIRVSCSNGRSRVSQARLPPPARVQAG